VTAPWEYRDPLESLLTPDISSATLMEHVRTIGALERESGSPGEAQAFDYIERTLKSYGVEVERREIEAYISLPQEARLALPDGAVIGALTHSFSASVEALDAEVVDVGDGRPEDLQRAAGKIALVRGLASPGRAWAAQQAGVVGQIHVLMDHLHNMIVTTIWGTPAPETAWRIPATPCLSILGADGETLRARLAQGPLRLRMTETNQQGRGLFALFQVNYTGNLASGRAAVDGQTQQTIVGRSAVDAYLFAVFQPFPGRGLTQQQCVVVTFMNEHFPVELEPGAVCTGRAKVLPPAPAVLDRLENGMAEGAGHHAVKGANGRLHIVAQQVSRGMWIIDRFVGHAPLLEEKVVFMIV